jgi:hypothetical protein
MEYETLLQIVNAHVLACSGQKLNKNDCHNRPLSSTY